MINYDKFAFATILSDDRIVMGHKLISSAFEKNKWLRKFIVFHSKTVCPLSDENKQKLSCISKYVTFIEADEHNYEMYMKTGKATPSMFKLEMFNLEGIERAIYLDCDCLILHDLISLFIKSINFGVVRNLDRPVVKESKVVKNNLTKLSTHMFVISKDMMTDHIYANLIGILNKSNAKKAENNAINHIFTNKYITLLSDCWCMSDKYFKGVRNIIYDLRVVHFSASKPWNGPSDDYTTINKLYGVISEPKPVPVNVVIQSMAPKKLVDTISDLIEFNIDEFRAEYLKFEEELKKQLENKDESAE